jgi:hypothetical protein
MKDSLARVTSPGYLSGLTALPMEQVRAMRAECQGLENALSYVRRVAQGRLDIVGAELARRRAGGDPADLSDLIGRLPDILADRTQSSGNPNARPPLDFAGDASGEEYSAEVDAIFGPADTGALTTLADAHLGDARARLAQYEQLTSARRRGLHDLIDQLQAEITRRYRTGEATVDSLLR